MRYNIEGGSLPILEMNLENGESVITQGGGMIWMSPNMQMDTATGSFGKAVGRMFTGESAFLNKYTAVGGSGFITVGSSLPGSIIPFEINPKEPIVVQKTGFLACTPGVELSVFFTKKVSSGVFGGEGLIMQKLSGSGMAFVEIDGYCKQYNLAPGQQIVVDTGYLAAMDATCRMEVQTVKGFKNMLFGGEGLFNTVVTGPGRVFLQSHPVAVLRAHMMMQ